MVAYRPRVVDTLLTDRLTSAGAVLIEGPKACGKTFTAEQQAGAASTSTPTIRHSRRWEWTRRWCCPVTLLEQTGVVRVDTLAQQLDVARVLACQPLPDGDRVALVGNGGGSLALAADACVDAGLVLAELGTGVRRQLAPAGPVPGRRRGCGPAPSTWGSRPVPTTLSGRSRPCWPTTGVDSVLVVCAPAPRQSTATWCAPSPAARADVRPQDAAGLRVRAAPADDQRRGVGTGRAGVRLPGCRRLRAGAGDAATPAGGARPRAEVVVPAGQRSGGGTGPGGGGPGRRAWPTLAVGGCRPRSPSTCSPPPACRSCRRGWPATPTQRPAAAGDLGYPVAVKSAARSRPAKTEAGGLALDVHDEAELRADAGPHGRGPRRRRLARRRAAHGRAGRRRGRDGGAAARSSGRSSPSAPAGSPPTCPPPRCTSLPLTDRRRPAGSSRRRRLAPCSTRLRAGASRICSCGWGRWSRRPPRWWRWSSTR